MAADQELIDQLIEKGAYCLELAALHREEVLWRAAAGWFSYAANAIEAEA